MTVKELIELLNGCDEDCEIYVDGKDISYISSGADIPKSG